MGSWSGRRVAAKPEFHTASFSLQIYSVACVNVIRHPELPAQKKEQKKRAADQGNKHKKECAGGWRLATSNFWSSPIFHIFSGWPRRFRLTEKVSNGIDPSTHPISFRQCRPSLFKNSMTSNCSSQLFPLFRLQLDNFLDGKTCNSINPIPKMYVGTNCHS